jgi:hypothetical protein
MQLPSLPNKLQILQHALGADRYGQGNQYRNRFVTGPGSTDYQDCIELCERGLMRRIPGNALTGGDDCFVVTPAGVDYVAFNSPVKPPEPKRTRSQQNYQNWLAADCGLTFAEWLGVETRPSWALA